MTVDITFGKLLFALDREVKCITLCGKGRAVGKETCTSCNRNWPVTAFLRTVLRFQLISDRFTEQRERERERIGWLVGCFGLNGPLRQYFSLYRAVSQRQGERNDRRE